MRLRSLTSRCRNLQISTTSACLSDRPSKFELRSGRDTNPGSDIVYTWYDRCRNVATVGAPPASSTTEHDGDTPVLQLRLSCNRILLLPGPNSRRRSGVRALFVPRVSRAYPEKENQGFGTREVGDMTLSPRRTQSLHNLSRPRMG